ncbi:MAG: domain S-box protein [Hyphomicrobiales bacterium]|nr:domain S-box protein [Hyphomicrobiales bacterium]
MSLASCAPTCALSARQQAVTPRSISSHLALLCIAIAIPLLACATAIQWTYANAEQQKLEDRGIGSVRQIAQLLDFDILSLQAILGNLASSLLIQSGDYTQFDAIARAFTEKTNIPVILSDPAGHALLDTSRDFGSELPNVDPSIREASQIRQPNVTNIYRDPITHEASYAIVAPIFLRSTADLTHVLHFRISTQRVLDVLLRSVNSQNIRASVIDRTGRILARSLNNASAQGMLWQGFERVSGVGEGVFRHANLEGVGSVTSFTRMQSTGWLVVDGVDSNVVDSPWRALVWQVAGMTGATFLTVGLIGLFLSRRLQASLQMLEANTIRIGAGAPLWDVVTPVLEVNRIGAFLTRSSVELQQANEGREALLFEVNHRVKNSLAVVTSILSMHARQSSSEQEKQALIELRSRIEIIARVHQSLYESGHHTRVNVGNFLKEVATTTLQALDPRRGCTLIATCDPDVIMPVSYTTPLALVAAELITNAIKHALKTDGRGAIAMRFHREGERGLSLQIVDDGVGLPADFDPARSKGVGMRIITGLLKQLRATMTTNAGEPGARFLITLDMMDDG